MLDKHPKVSAIGEISKAKNRSYFKMTDSVSNKIDKFIKRSTKEYTVFEIKSLIDKNILCKD